MKKALIIGMGESGQSSADYLENNDYEIYYFDRRLTNRKYKKLRLKDLKDDRIFFDIVIKSPGIKNSLKIVSLARLKTNNFMNDIELFFLNVNKPIKIIAITGTNGKTTLATYIYTLLSNAHPSCFLCGNIGVSPLRIISKITENSIIVMELSSFQIELLSRFKADVVILTNISPNHLDMVSLDHYCLSKYKLLRMVKSDGYIFTSVEATLLGEYLNLNVNKNNYELKDRTIYKNSLPYFTSDSLHLFELNHVLTALKVSSLFSNDDEKIVLGLKSLESVRFRMEKINANYPLEFINDSKSSNVASLKQALKEYEDKKRILIIGGIYKSEGLNEIKFRSDDIIFTYGRDGRKILESIGKGEYLDNLEDILTLIKKRRYRDYTLIFSPACSSFDQYKNYVHRGEEFNRLIKEIFDE